MPVETRRSTSVSREVSGDGPVTAGANSPYRKPASARRFWPRARLPRACAVHELPQPQGRDRVVSFTEEVRYLANASRNLRDAAILAERTTADDDFDALAAHASTFELDID